MSQTAQAVKKLQASHKLALSGTPIENKLEELWSVFDFLMPGFCLVWQNLILAMLTQLWNVRIKQLRNV